MVGPRSDLDSGRLNEVRRALHVPLPAGTRVADIANRRGFWHMGAFVAGYRRMLGELPSETLDRSERS